MIPERLDTTENRRNTYNKDGRWPIEELFSAYDELTRFGWSREVITTQQDGNIQWPIFAFCSHPSFTLPRKSLYVLSGVHGEEPAAPMAVVQELKTLLDFAQRDIPVVLLPFLNPKGYVRDWRYENERRDYRKGQSVTDSEDYLAALRTPNQPKYMPTGQTAQQITKWMLTKSLMYLPHLIFDHHEDEIDGDDPLFHTYIYFYGNTDHLPLAHKVTKILVGHGMPISFTDKTRFGETIENGVVYNSPDGSIDELFASRFYAEDGVIQSKYAASAVIVVETTIRPDIRLERRVEAHKQIIRSYAEFWGDVSSE